MCAQRVEGTHGRIDKQILTVGSMLQTYSDWPDLTQVFQVVRHVPNPHTGETTEEISYGVTNLQRQEVSAARLLQILRGPWSSEMGCTIGTV